MIDGTSTSRAWQSHPTDILVLPVGAFEQHSVHLPLTTDSLQNGHCGRLMAERPFKRMQRVTAQALGGPRHLFASGGPEIG